MSIVLLNDTKCSPLYDGGKRIRVTWTFIFLILSFFWVVTAKETIFWDEVSCISVDSL